MSIVTRTGDTGSTGLYGDGRTSKASKRMHACGTVDELNAVIGMARSVERLSPDLAVQLLKVQHMLFRVGADLAASGEHVKTKRVAQAQILDIERWIAMIEPALPPQTSFLLPGGSVTSAHLHHARTVCRRAERCVIALAEEEDINPLIKKLLNRLGDYLFLAARKANNDAGTEDIPVSYD